MNHRTWMFTLVAALLGTGLLVQAPAAVAGLVETDQLAAQAEINPDIKTIDNFLARADVQNSLEKMGLNHVITADRVALLSDSEARLLAEKINQMPAGGNFSSLTSQDIIIILLVAILLVLIL
jgi:hypothetical protein